LGVYTIEIPYSHRATSSLLAAGWFVPVSAIRIGFADIRSILIVVYASMADVFVCLREINDDDDDDEK